MIRWFINFTELLADCLLKFIGKKENMDAKEGVVQFVRFSLVGLSNTVVGYMLYVMSLFCMQKLYLLSCDYIFAQAISFVISVYWAFYWNNKCVFVLPNGEKRNYRNSLFKTYLTYSFTGLFLNSIFLILWISWLGISEYLAPLLNLVISVPVNFFLNKFWAFRKR